MTHEHHHWLALAGFLVFVFWAVVGVALSMRDKYMNESSPPMMTEEEFEQLKKDLREYQKWCEDNQPPPQGDYQWKYGYFNGGFGGYTALFHKGKKIGGMFEAGSFADEYHRFDETGGVYPEKSMPPVGFPGRLK